jgi:hypothetical protein
MSSAQADVVTHETTSAAALAVIHRERTIVGIAAAS